MKKKLAIVMVPLGLLISYVSSVALYYAFTALNIWLSQFEVLSYIINFISDLISDAVEFSLLDIFIIALALVLPGLFYNWSEKLSPSPRRNRYGLFNLLTLIIFIVLAGIYIYLFFKNVAPVYSCYEELEDIGVIKKLFFTARDTFGSILVAHTFFVFSFRSVFWILLGRLTSAERIVLE